MMQKVMSGISGMVRRVTAVGLCKYENSIFFRVVHINRCIYNIVYLSFLIFFVLSENANAANCTSIVKTGGYARELSIGLFGSEQTVSCAYLDTPYVVSSPADGMAAHAGIDFAVPAGTAVKSVTNGSVVRVDGSGPVTVADGKGLGSVSVKTLDGKLVSYLHLSNISATIGTIKIGDPIGLSGSTGAGSANHLHIEARVNTNSTGPIGKLSCLNKITCSLEEMTGMTSDPIDLSPIVVSPVNNNRSTGDISITGNGFGITAGRVDVFIPFLKSNPANSNRTVSVAIPQSSWTDKNIVMNLFSGFLGYQGFEKDFNMPFKLSVYKSDGSLAASFNYPFFDVKPEDSLSCYVIQLWKKGMVNGKGANKYDPHGSKTSEVTRSEFLRMAMNAKNGPGQFNIPPAQAPFYDVTTQEYAGYVDSAKRNGFLTYVTNDCNNPSQPQLSSVACFFPDRSITRFEAVSILSSVFGLTTNANELLSSKVSFIDAPNSAPYSQTVYPVATNKGDVGCNGNEPIVGGYGNGMFGVNNFLQRDEAAKLIALSMAHGKVQ